MLLESATDGMENMDVIEIDWASWSPALVLAGCAVPVLLSLVMIRAYAFALDGLRQVRALGMTEISCTLH